MTAIGIDLGTTNSAVAVHDKQTGGARVLRNGEGQVLTPSVVGVHTTGATGVQTFAVGTPAVNWAFREARDTIFSVKRLMGRDFLDDAVVETNRHMSYDIVPGPGQDPRAHVMLAGQMYSPVQVSTMILEKLAEDAAAHLPEPPTHAVITVPAYFNEAQRVATREAGEKAGLVVKRIIDEPTAAAVAFGVDLREGDKRRVLVFDLGGGTFDISILNATRDAAGRNHLQVLDFSGDNWLGGDDFDLLIVKRIIDWVKETADLDPSHDAKFLYKAKYEAEKAKRQLSQTQVVDIIIPAAYRADGVIVDIDLQLTRAEYEVMIAGLVDTTIGLVRAALDRQKLVPDDISDVLLAGGSTLTPKVYESVEALFGRDKVRRNVDPMECVALGAGILAGTQHGIECGDPACATVNDEKVTECVACHRPLFDARAVGDTNLYEVTGQALGIAAVYGMNGDSFVSIIPRGTPYPVTQPLKRTFEATNGRKIVVPVYEGDDPVASRNQEIGRLDYDLPHEIAARAKVDVEFLYDRNRTLFISVIVPGTDLRHYATLRHDAPGRGPSRSRS
ncbi:Hsp70 family protein [Catenulispora yoronensis]